MVSINDKLTLIIKETVKSCGYDYNLLNESLIEISNRPDLSQFQSNFALKFAKIYKKNPKDIANEIALLLNGNPIFSRITVDGPGFININVSDEYLVEFINEISNTKNFGIKAENPIKIIIDYGGPNIAKPLHVGHLRSAIIGEGLKRLSRLLGHEVIGDVHLGDWGRQMGMVISEIKKRNPELPYFNENYTGEYPQGSPVTINELEEIYPKASLDAKNDESRMEEAREATSILQDENHPNHRGYYALWKHLVSVSVSDLKKIYERLGVSFDLWNGESDSYKDIPEMLSILKEQNLIEYSDNTLIMNVSEIDDTKEIPPLILKTQNNTYGYHATELATMLDRVRNYNPDEIWYVVDKRQSLHFEQCFRAAYKSGILPKNVDMQFLGFGTMNGKDGKPFKTRDGGVMKLTDLLDLVKNHEKEIMTNNYSESEIEKISEQISQGCIKYADAISNRETDYIFDIDKFTNVNGKTGAYILYSTVRINSMLKNAVKQNLNIEGNLAIPHSDVERKVLLSISKISDIVTSAYNNRSLNIIAEYLYELNSNYGNFYNSFKILTESDEAKRDSWIKLSFIVKKVNELLLSCLSIEIPSKM